MRDAKKQGGIKAEEKGINYQQLQDYAGSCPSRVSSFAASVVHMPLPGHCNISSTVNRRPCDMWIPPLSLGHSMSVIAMYQETLQNYLALGLACSCVPPPSLLLPVVLRCELRFSRPPLPGHVASDPLTSCHRPSLAYSLARVA